MNGYTWAHIALQQVGQFSGEKGIDTTVIMPDTWKFYSFEVLTSDNQVRCNALLCYGMSSYDVAAAPICSAFTQQVYHTFDTVLSMQLAETCDMLNILRKAVPA